MLHDPERLLSERDDARRWAVRLDGMAARAQAGQASQALLCERAEQDRDRALQRLSSCSAENAAFRAQRDEAVRALADLLAALGRVDDAGLPDHDAARGVAPPALIARQLVERYRQPVPATIERS
jgi:hypothetical protein